MTTITALNETVLVNKLAKLIEKYANAAIEENDLFLIGLSGGSLVKFLTNGLPTIATDYSKWRLFFCDERIVPVNDPDSTFGVYKSKLIPIVPLKEEQFIQIKQGLSADDTAKDYIQQLLTYFPSGSLPRFDVLLLGMGPDGHTCSLFPNHPLLDETSVWVAPITDSPKPPPSRITLTLPVINNASVCVFAVAGEEKADMVKRLLVDKEDLPASRVRPTNGSLFWILDKGAAKYVLEK